MELHASEAAAVMPPPPSLKISSPEPVDDAELSGLMRTELAKLGLLPSGIDDAAVIKLYRTWQTNRDGKLARERERRERETAAAAKEAVLEGLRTALRRFGVQPDPNATEQQLRSEVESS